MFSANQILKRHVLMVHDKVKDFHCDRCDQKFGLKGDLTRHITAVHLKQQNFKCETCERKFSKKQSLTIHVLMVHDKVKDFHCDRCDQKFGLKRDLTRHITAVHLKQQNFKCETCERKFGRKSDLKQHILRRHPEILVKQITVSEPIRPPRMTYEELQDCIMEALKVFECDHCDKEFGEESHLTKHVTTVHVNQKNFKCKICERKFTSTGYLKRHILKFHSEASEPTRPPPDKIEHQAIPAAKEPYSDMSNAMPSTSTSAMPYSVTPSALADLQGIEMEEIRLMGMKPSNVSEDDLLFEAAEDMMQLGPMIIDPFVNEVNF
jgi:uncharacterized Zn-finger protein